LFLSCSPEPKKPPPPPAPAVEEKPVESDESIVRRLFDTWVTSQNDGDFKTYSGLYAQRFRGDRVAGDKLRTYERVSWLDERRQLMRYPTKLNVKDARFVVGANAVHVEFDQTYDHFEFKEKGPKLLIFVREPAGFRIAFERPYLNEEPSSAAPVAHFVTHVAGKNFVVLERSAQPQWRANKPIHVDRSGAVLSVIDGTSEALPAERAAWRGKDFELISASGERCATKVSDLAVMAAVEPPWEEFEALTGKEAEQRTADQVAKILFDIARPEDVSLVGSIEGCEGAFAVAPGQPVFVREINGAMQLGLKSIEPVAKRVPAVAALQDDFVRFYGGGPPRATWFTEVTSHSITGEPDFAVVELRGSGETADWYGGLTLLVRGVTKGKLRVLGASPVVNAPGLLLDLGRDGTWELYTRPGELYGDLVRLNLKGGEVLGRLRHSEFACGC
jgi:hypothetical protein